MAGGALSGAGEGGVRVGGEGGEVRRDHRAREQFAASIRHPHEGGVAERRDGDCDGAEGAPPRRERVARVRQTNLGDGVLIVGILVVGVLVVGIHHAARASFPGRNRTRVAEYHGAWAYQREDRLVREEPEVRAPRRERRGGVRAKIRPRRAKTREGARKGVQVASSRLDAQVQVVHRDVRREHDGEGTRRTAKLQALRRHVLVDGSTGRRVDVERAPRARKSAAPRDTSPHSSRAPRYRRRLIPPRRPRKTPAKNARQRSFHFPRRAATMGDEILGTLLKSKGMMIKDCG